MKRKLLEIHYDARAVFVERPNRFLGLVNIEDEGTNKVEKVHVRDPGRLKEILCPGNQVLIRKAKNSNRKTRWDLIAGKVEDKWVLVNSGFHRDIAQTILNDATISPFGEIEKCSPEQTYGKSRLDFLVIKGGKNIWVEVKGCTLAIDRRALFPDAPTTRGKRHVEELIKAKGEGHRAALIILVFRDDAICFAPKEDTDPDFAKVFRKAVDSGVEVYPVLMGFDEGAIFYKGLIPVC